MNTKLFETNKIISLFEKFSKNFYFTFYTMWHITLSLRWNQSRHSLWNAMVTTMGIFYFSVLQSKCLHDYLIIVSYFETFDTYFRNENLNFFLLTFLWRLFFFCWKKMRTRIFYVNFAFECYYSQTVFIRRNLFFLCLSNLIVMKQTDKFSKRLAHNAT